MATFAEFYKQQKESQNKAGNFSEYFRSTPLAAELRKKREEDALRKVQEERQKKIDVFNRSIELANQYNAEAEGETTYFNELSQSLPGKATGIISGLYDYIKSGNLKSDVSNFLKKKKEAYDTSIKENGIAGTQKDIYKGGAKNIAELASGVAKTAIELSPYTGYSGIRKIIRYVGGEKVADYVDRNTPEYQKEFGAWVDENQILNYKPEYANEIQKTGGEVAEIGSWFIPITRSGSVGKIEKAIAELPNVAKILGTTPNIAKIGGKYFYEVSKDVVDVATLDALRGKDFETIKEDAQYAGIGGGAIRALTGGLKSILAHGKENRMIDTVEKSIGQLSDEEKTVAKNLLNNNRPIDDISAEIISKRISKGENPISEAVPETNVVTETEKPVQKEEVVTPELTKSEKTIPQTKIKDIASKEFDTAINADRGIYKKEERKKIYEDIIKPKLDALPEPKEGEVIVYRSGKIGDGSYVNTSPSEVFTYPVEKDFKVEIVKESSLKTTGSKEKDSIGYRLLSTQKSTVKKSVTAQKMNEVLGTNFEEEYGVRGIKETLNKVAGDLEKDYDKTVAKAFSESGDTVEQVAILAELFGKSQKSGKKMQGDIFARLKEFSTSTGQTLNVFKALTASNPHFGYMQRVVSARLGNAGGEGWNLRKIKLNSNKRSQFNSDVQSVKKSLKKELKEAVKIEDAQKVLNDLMC